MHEKNTVGNWKARLAGQALPVTLNEPEYGYYRVKGKTGWEPVNFYWGDDGVPVCRFGAHIPKVISGQEACDLWPRAAERPITYELYDLIVKGGKWPDLNEVVSRSNNAPPDDSFVGYEAIVSELEREAQRLLDVGAAKTKEEAESAADLVGKLMELGKKGPVIRQADPDLTPELKEAATKAQNITTRWIPVILKTEIYKKLKNLVIAPYQLAAKAAHEAEEKRKQDAHQKLQAEKLATHLVEVERLKQEAAALGQNEMPSLPPAPVYVPPPRAEPAPKINVGGARSGTRAIGLRAAPPINTIEDLDAVIKHVGHTDEVKEFYQKIVDRAYRAKLTIPGVRSEKSAPTAA